MDGLETAAASAWTKGLVTTDVGKWLDLPIGLKVNWGYDDPDWNAFAAITHYDALSIYLSPDEYWGADVVVSYKMVEFEFAINPGAKNNSGDVGYLLAGVAVKEPIKGLSAEVYYFQGATHDPNATPIDTYDAGVIAVDAVYAMEFGDVALKVAPTFAFYLDDAVTPYGAWRWVAAAKATYKMIEASAELTGMGRGNLCRHGCGGQGKTDGQVPTLRRHTAVLHGRHRHRPWRGSGRGLPRGRYYDVRGLHRHQRRRGRYRWQLWAPARPMVASTSCGT